MKNKKEHGATKQDNAFKGNRTWWKGKIFNQKEKSSASGQEGQDLNLSSGKRGKGEETTWTNRRHGVTGATGRYPQIHSERKPKPRLQALLNWDRTVQGGTSARFCSTARGRGGGWQRKGPEMSVGVFIWVSLHSSVTMRWAENKEEQAVGSDTEPPPEHEGLGISRAPEASSKCPQRASSQWGLN